MALDVKAAIKERCRNLSYAIATSQDGGAIRDMKQRLAEAQAVPALVTMMVVIGGIPLGNSCLTKRALDLASFVCPLCL